MFPRRDTPLLLVPRKDNSHGLGYTPGMSLNEAVSGKGNAEAKGPRLAGRYWVCRGENSLADEIVGSGLWSRCFE